MADQPLQFPRGIEATAGLNHTRQGLTNCFWNGKDQVISRPGIEATAAPLGVCRGSFRFNERLFKVYGPTLYQITNAGTTLTDIGNVSGTAPIAVADGFSHAAIVSSDGDNFILTTGNVLQRITDVDLPACRDVTHINSRFVFIPVDGSPALYSEVGDAEDIRPLNFFDAEVFPDKNKASANLRNDLYIFGGDSVEVFRGTPDPLAPFQRVTGAMIPNGFFGGKLEYNGTVLFCGNSKDHDVGIYAINQGQAPKISNEAVDTLLEALPMEAVEACIAARFVWRGYDIAVFNFGSFTLGYFGAQWFILETSEGPWKAEFMTFYEGDYYVGSEDRLGKLVASNKDYQYPIDRIIDGFIDVKKQRKFSIQSLEFDVSQGTNTEQGGVALSMSKDNVVHGPRVYRAVGDIGNRTALLRWNPPGGLGAFDGFAGYRLFTREDIQFSAQNLVAVTR